MRIVSADCSIIYTGRGNTTLNRGVRAIVIKGDGSVAVHSNEGIKPLNYMKAAVFSETEEDKLSVWTFDSRGESLRIVIHELLNDVMLELSQEEEGLIRDGTEPQLQAWLASNLWALRPQEHDEEEFTLIGKEFPTGHGPVDLFVGGTEFDWAVEVKRVATMSAVYQVKRYVDALNAEPTGDKLVKGMLVALDVRPRAVELAEKRGIRTVTLPADWNSKDTVAKEIKEG